MKTKLRTVLTMSVLALLVALAGALVAGCGGGSSSTTAESTSTTGPSEGASSGDAAAFAAKWYKGSFVEPKLKPIKIPSGKDVWLITYGQAAKASQEVSKVFTEYGPQVGWQVHVFDGKFEQNRWLEGVRTAIASGADIIAGYTIDCSKIASALKEAAAAEVPYINIGGQDCNEEGGEKLYSYSVPLEPGNVQIARYCETVGESQGAWVAAAEPTAKILAMVESDTICTSRIGEGFTKAIEQHCPECEISEELPFVGTEIGPPLQAKVEQALLKNPDITVANANYDDVLINSLLPAVRNAGRSGQVKLISEEGQKAVMSEIHSGEVASDTGVCTYWEGFALMDAVARWLAGKEPESHTGVGAQLIDAEHNLPPEGQQFTPSVDFKAAYLKAWGLS